MKLDEYMKGADQDTIYCLGAKSGFVFVGTPDEYERDIDGISQKKIEAMEIAIRRCEKGAQTKKKAGNAANYRKKIAAFIPFREREIKETFRTNDNDVVVLFEGDEEGKYWTRNEYIGVEKSKVEHIPGSEESIAENYANLAKTIVEKAAYSYESGYRRMKEVFGPKEFFPDTYKELADLLSVQQGTLLEKMPGEAMEAYYQARRFFLGPTFAIYSAADPYKIMEHIEGLIDSGSSLRLQAIEMQKERERRNRIAKRKNMGEE